MKPTDIFLADLKRSEAAAELIAASLRGRGVKAQRPRTRVRPDESVRREYADDGDIHVEWRDESYRIEVKHRRHLHFTRSDDYPYRTVIVDEVYNYHQKQMPLLAYVVSNADGTSFVELYPEDKHLWKTERRYDPHQDRVCDFYVCPKYGAYFTATDTLLTKAFPVETESSDG